MIRNSFLVTLLITFSLHSTAQQFPVNPNITDDDGKRHGTWTLLYTEEWKVTNKPEKASFYRIIEYSDDLPVGITRDFYGDGTVQWEGKLLADRPSDVADGKAFYYREDGSLNYEAVFTNGELQGQIEFDVSGNPIVETWKDLYYFGDHYWNREEWEEASRIYQLTIDVAIEAGDSASNDIANVMNDMGLCNVNLKNYEIARQFYIRSVSIKEKVVGTDSDSYLNTAYNHAISYYNEGDVYWYTKEYEKAIPIYIEAKKHFEKYGFTEVIQYGNLLNDIGVCYNELENYEKSYPYLLEAMRVKELILEPNDQNLNSTRLNLGLNRYNIAVGLNTEEMYDSASYLLREAYDYACSSNLYSQQCANITHELAAAYSNLNMEDSTEYFYKECISIKDSVDGYYSVSAALERSYLASLYSRQFRFQESLELYRQAKEIYWEVLPEDDDRVRSSTKNYGSLLFDLERYADARAQFEIALELAHKYHGDTSLTYAYSCNNLSITIDKMGKFREALDYLEIAEEILKKELGEVSVDYAINLGNQGNSYNNLGQYDECEKRYVQATKIYNELFGIDDKRYVGAIHDLARFYLDKSDYKRADSLYAKIAAYWVDKDEVDTEYNSFILDMASLRMAEAKYDEAEKYARKSLELSLQLKGEGSKRYINGIDYLAQIYQAQGRYKEAEKLFKENLERSAKYEGTNSVDYTFRLNNLGNVYSDMGQFDKAQEYLKKSLELDEKIYGTKTIEYAITLNNLAIVIDELGNFDVAEEYYLKVAEIEEEIYNGNSPRLGRTYTNIGSFYQSKGDLAKADIYLRKGVELFESTLGEYHRNLINSYRYLGSLQASLGDDKKAEDYLLKAELVAKKSLGEDHPDLSYVYNDLGIFYDDQKMYERSKRYYEESYRIRLKHFGESNQITLVTLNNLGALAGSMDRLSEALFYLEKSVNLYNAKSDEQPLDLAASTHNMAYNLSTQGLKSLALDYYKKTEDIFLQYDDPFSYDYLLTLLNMGVAQSQLGLIPDAKKSLFKMSDMLDFQIRNNFSTLTENEKTNYLGKVRYAFGVQANFWYKNYMENPELTDWILRSQLRNKGLIFRSTDKVRKTIFSSNDQELINLYYEWKSQKEYLGKAFEMDKATRALNGINVYEIEENVNRLEKELATRSSSFGNTISLDETDWKDIQDKLKEGEAAIEIFRFVNEKESMYASFIGKGIAVNKLPNGEIWFSKIIKDSPAYRAGLRPNDKLIKLNGKEFTEEQDVIDALNSSPLCEIKAQSYQTGKFRKFKFEEDTVYQYEKLYTPIYAALIIKPGLEHPETVIFENGEELETKWINYYKRAIRFKIKDQESYRHFWQPLAEKIEGVNNVYLSVDGIFHTLSFGTLLDTETNKYLEEELDIHVLGNLTDILKETPEDSITNTALFGFPDYNLDTNAVDSTLIEEPAIQMDTTQRFFSGDYITELPGTKTEIEKIEEILKSNNIRSTTYTGLAASEPAVKNISSPDILHIATHGFFLQTAQTGTESSRGMLGMDREIVMENPLFRSGLLFSNAKNSIEKGGDGILTAYEANNLDLVNTKLVVLSACETGLGEIKNGEGVYGLQRSMQTAGAQSVLMSLWTVSDEATQELMTLFYENWLEKGLSKREAFDKAKAHLRKKYKDPYFWGAFILVGE